MGEQPPVTDPCPVGPCPELRPNPKPGLSPGPGLAPPRAGDVAVGRGQGLGSPCSSAGLGCSEHPWGRGIFSPSMNGSLAPRGQTLCEDTAGGG